MWTSPLAKGGPSCRTNLAAPARLSLDFAVKLRGFPLFQALGFARDQIGLHGEVRARQIQCVFIFHGKLKEKR